MARSDEAARWLKQGLRPGKIAQQMGVSIKTVMPYLYKEIGEGHIRRSDILFSFDQGTRDAIEDAIAKAGGTTGVRYRLSKPVSRDDLDVYLQLRDARVALGDMYEAIRDIEVGLHSFLKRVLIEECGADKWWRQCVPQQVRKQCTSIREEDPEPVDDPYCYTTLTNLKDVLDANWAVVSPNLPKPLGANKRKLDDDLVHLNEIRKSVMHPIRGHILTDKDFTFVRELKAKLEHVLKATV